MKRPSELTSTEDAALARIKLGKARRCGVRAMETFAKELEQDGDSVWAALTSPRSNAQVEGQITKLKLMKRQMYGRASFDLPRRFVLRTI